MLRRELDEIIEDIPKSQGQITWKDCLNLAVQNYSKIKDWKTHPQSYISKIKDYNSFLAFKKEWMQVFKDIHTIPVLLQYINDYQGKINDYNKGILEKTDKGIKILDMPYMYSKDEFSSLFVLSKLVNEFTAKDYDFISSKDFKNKIFKHTIGILNIEDSMKLINEGHLSEATLKSLPLLISPNEVFSGETKTKQEAEAIKNNASTNYHSNLEALYQHIGFNLPEVAEINTKLVGVTYDNRQKHLQALYTDYADCKDIPLIAERKYYEGKPSVQIYAQPNPNEEPIDLGFISATLANDIEQGYNNAKIEVAFDKLDSIMNEGKTTYYATLNLMVSNEPEKIVEKEEETEHVLETE